MAVMDATAAPEIASVFAQYEVKNFPYVYRGRLHVPIITGGTPRDPKVAEGWIRTKLVMDTDDLLRQAVAETMAEAGVGAEEATEKVLETRNLTGFKRDEAGLYYEGRCLKSCLKEAVCVAGNAGNLRTKGWGNPDNANYKKGIKAWFPEHVFVREQKLRLLTEDGEPFGEPTGISQNFVHSQYGASIKYAEYCENATLEFTVESDYEFAEKEWAAIWLTAQRQGIGADRSQGSGRFQVVEWERL